MVIIFANENRNNFVCKALRLDKWTFAHVKNGVFRNRTGNSQEHLHMFQINSFQIEFFFFFPFFFLFLQNQILLHKIANGIKICVWFCVWFWFLFSIILFEWSYCLALDTQNYTINHIDASEFSDRLCFLIWCFFHNYTVFN